tara:strand:+ start:15 stop:791 length:777 start_codon:yes stop_codon:yes gene_type:complete
MTIKDTNLIANKLVNAFLKNKIISPIPNKYTKTISAADKIRKICEKKVKRPIIGFKAGATAIPLLKKFNEKEPFYAAVFKQNLLNNKKKVKINKFTLGIELEVCYIVKKNILDLKKPINKKKLQKFITYMAPCIEVVGYRQKKFGIKSLGDLCSDFGANMKFIVGPKKKFKKININNLKTNILNPKTNQSVDGNTKSVYIDPINSLKFVINKIIKDKVKLNKDFYVFTGSTVGVVPLSGKGIYNGKIEKIGKVQTKIV